MLTSSAYTVLNICKNEIGSHVVFIQSFTVINDTETTQLAQFEAHLALSRR